MEISAWRQTRAAHCDERNEEGILAETRNGAMPVAVRMEDFIYLHYVLLHYVPLHYVPLQCSGNVVVYKITQQNW